MTRRTRRARPVGAKSTSPAQPISRGAKNGPARPGSGRRVSQARTAASAVRLAGLWYAAPLVAVALFALLAIFGGDVGANEPATRWLQAAIPTTIGDQLAVGLVLGSTSGTVALVALGGGFLWWRGERRAALALGLLGVGILIELALKAWLGHPGIPEVYHRDPRWYPAPEISAKSLDLPSPFPSGHAMRSTFISLVGVAVVARYLPRFAPLARVAAAVVVLSVATLLVYMGWHWVTDVVGGALLGFALAAPARRLIGVSRR